MNQRVKVRAEVRDGYIVVREATDLPNGTVVDLVDEDPYTHFDDGDDLDDHERTKLHASLDTSWEQAQRGESGRPLKGILKSL